MGKVFSWDDIVKGRIPKLSSFNKVKEEIAKKLSECGGVIGAIFCGSVVRGDHNIRSDFDCLVLYNGKERQGIIELLQGLSLFAEGLNIPVEFIPVDNRLVETMMHPIEYSFSLHLQWSAKNGGVIKKNPVPFLHLDSSVMTAELVEYIRRKHSKLSKTWSKLPSLGPDQRFTFYQKVLDAPVYIARKILRWRGVDITFDDSRRAIAELFSVSRNDAGVGELFAELIACDREYTDGLMQHIRSHNKEKYVQLLQEVERAIPKVLDFIQINILEISEKMEA